MRQSVLACAIVVAALGLAGAGCGQSGETVARFGSEGSAVIPARAGSVVVEGCELDAWQTEQLASSSAHAVLTTVIFLCPTARDDGTIAPIEPVAQQALAQQLAAVHALGYEARLALSMLDELDQPYPGDVMAAALASSTWRAAVTGNVAPFAAMADGVDLQLPPPPAASRGDVTALVSALATALHGKSFDVFAPPGGASSDVPGADAYDLGAIGPLVERVRLMTLDYSCCSGSPGPTIDSGWAVDVQRAARASTAAPLDVAFPLYGWDFGPEAQRAVTTVEAQGVAEQAHAHVQRGPSGALFYDWQDESGGDHETWFDDGTSASWTLSAWDAQTLPPDVGVVFWGLGSEDPALWDTVAKGMVR
jgi:spore germination protein YaaH